MGLDQMQGRRWRRQATAGACTVTGRAGVQGAPPAQLLRSSSDRKCWHRGDSRVGWGLAGVNAEPRKGKEADQGNMSILGSRGESM